MTSPDLEPIGLSQLSLGSIRNDSLSPELLEHIKAVYDVVGPYLETSLEQFEIGFMRDSDPESEVVVWCSIVAAWIVYHEQYLDDQYLIDDEEKKLLAALISISTGVDDPKILGVSEDVGTKLLACYDELGED